MGAWLYQMAVTEWNPARYRAEVWEGRQETWPIKSVHGTTKIAVGDLLVLFFVPSNNPEPGVYGWAVVTARSRKKVTFRLCPPSNYLKTDPLWNPSISAMIDRIRGGMPRGTMWPISDKEIKPIQSALRRRIDG